MIDARPTRVRHLRKRLATLEQALAGPDAGIVIGDGTYGQRWATMRADVVSRLGALGCCRCCGRELSDPVSVSAGIGPDCARR